MKRQWKKTLATVLLVLMVGQMTPTAWVNAFAEQVSIISETMALTPQRFYSVKFVNHDGREIVSQLVAADSLAIPPEAPTRAASGEDGGDVSWTFSGWDSDAAAVPSPDAPILADVTFTARYVKLEKVELRIRYLPAVEGDTVTLPPDAVLYYMLGETIDASIPSPYVTGYKADPAVVAYQGTAAASMEMEVVYAPEQNMTYAVLHMVEADGVVGEPDPANPAHFSQYAAEAPQSVPYGYQPNPQARALPGYTPLNPVVEPVTEDTALTIYYKKNTYNLVFDPNGAGATYCEPVITKVNEAVAWPIPTREGYTFAGWFANPDGTGQQYSQANTPRMPAGNLVVYAKWMPQMVSYKVVYWLERPNFSGTPDPTDPEHFIFYKEDATRRALAGSTVTVGDEGSVVTVRVGTTDKKIASFLASDTAVISGDGTTVVNVYYARDLFTIVLNAVESGGGSTYTYAFPDNTSVMTIYAKYEQEFPGNWPVGDLAPKKVRKSNGSTYLYTNWAPQNALGGTTGWASKRLSFTSEMLPTGTSTTLNLTAVYHTSTTVYEWQIDYYFERLPDEPQGQQRSGVWYVLDSAGGFSQKLYASGSTTANLTGKQIEGFTYVGDTSGRVETTSPSRTCSLYYTRNRYSLSFDRMTSSAAVPQPATVSSILFGDKLSSHLPSGWVAGVSPTYTAADGVEYTFGGWYKDASYDTPVMAGDTLPKDGLKLFAKWNTRAVTVDIVVDGEVAYQVETYVGMTLGDKFPTERPAKHGYTFVGWYWNNMPFISGTRVPGDIRVEARFEPISTGYTVRYVYADEAGTTTLRPDKKVSGRMYGEAITAGSGANVMEAALEIPGYMLARVEPEDGRLVLGQEDSENEITFTYVTFDHYEYRVHYLLEGTDLADVRAGSPEGIVHASTDILSTKAIQIVLWPKLGSADYYAVDPMRTVTLTANSVTEIVFYYKSYVEVAWEAVVSLIGEDGIPVAISTERKTGRIGETVRFTEADWPERLEYGAENGYTLDPAHPGTRLSAVIKSADDAVTLQRFYVKDHTVAFSAGENGSLLPPADGQLSRGVSHRTQWQAAWEPSPQPDPGYYFVGWQPSFPASVQEDGAFEATFSRKTGIVVRANSHSPLYDGQPHKAEGYAIYDAENGTLLEGLTATGLRTSNPEQVNAGTYGNDVAPEEGFALWDAAGENVTAKYEVTFESGTLTIGRRPLTVAAEWATVAFDGQTHTITGYSADGNLLAGHTVAATVGGGTGAVPGAYPLTLSDPAVTDGANDVTANYEIATANGLLTVTDREEGIPLVVTADSARFTYDGTAHTSAGTYAYAYDNGAALPQGVSLAVEVETVGRVDAGTEEINILSVAVLHGGTDVTANYAVETVAGSLVIDKRPLTVAGQIRTEQFDGSTVYTVGYDVAGTIVAGQSLEVEMSGGQGRTPGAYPLVLGKVGVVAGNGPDTADMTENYDIQASDGLLTVAPRAAGDEIPLRVTVGNAARPYTGSEQTAEVTQGNPDSVVEIDGAPVPAGTAVTFTASGRGTAVGTYEINVAAHRVMVTNPDGTASDMTAQYKLAYIPGTFEITQRTARDGLFPLTLTADSETRVYTGEAISADGTYKITDGALMGGAALAQSIVVAGGGTQPGRYGIAIDKASAVIMDDGVDVTESYDITLLEGTLEITQRTARDGLFPLTLTANSEAYPYTGSLIEAEGTYAVTEGALVAGGRLSDLAIAGGGIQPGRYGIAIDKASAVITDNGVDVTESYDITLLEGVLEITPLNGQDRIPLTIQLADEERIYDGAEQVVTQTEATPGTGILIGGDGENVVVTFEAWGGGINATEPGGEYAIDIATDAQGAPKVTVRTTGGADVTANYALEAIPGRLTIGRRPLLVQGRTMEVPFDFTWHGGELDGLATEAPQSGLAAGHAAEAGDLGGWFFPGAYQVVIPRDKVAVRAGGVDVTRNYDISVADGTLTILGADDPDGPAGLPIAVSPVNPGPVVYDGQDHVHGAFAGRSGELAALAAAQGVSAEANISLGTPVTGQNAGTYPITFTAEEVEIWVTAGNETRNLANQFHIETVSGAFEILRRPLTVRGVVETLPYTGQWQYGRCEASPEDGETGLAAGHALAAEPTGESGGKLVRDEAYQVLPDATAVTVTDGDGTIVTDSYEIRAEPGELTIRQRTAADGLFTLTLAADDEEMTYTGQAVHAQGTWRFVGEGPKGGGRGAEDIVVAGSGVNADTYPIAIDPGTVRILDGEGQETADVTASYDVTLQEGTLTIAPKPLRGTLTASGALQGEYVYGDYAFDPQGAALAPADGFGLADGEALAFEIVQRGTDGSVVADEANPASARNAGTYDFFPVLGDNPNYDVTGIQCVASAPFTVLKKALTVSPLAAERADRDWEPEIAFTVEGYAFGETLQAVGPQGVRYASTAPASGPEIGRYDILYAEGSGQQELDNYTVTYENLPQGMLVYGQLYFHSNYPVGAETVVLRGKYTGQDDAVEPLPAARALGIGRDSLRFAGWSMDEDETETLFEAGAEIGSIQAHSVDLYAQWGQLYKLEVRHETADGETVAPTEIFWLEDGAMHQLQPLETEGYAPRLSLYTSEGTEYLGPPDAFILMPKDEVIAVIEYGSGSAAEELPEEQKEKGETKQSLYTVMDEDIPLGGIGSRTAGKCFE